MRAAEIEMGAVYYVGRSRYGADYVVAQQIVMEKQGSPYGRRVDRPVLSGREVWWDRDGGCMKMGGSKTWALPQVVRKVADNAAQWEAQLRTEAEHYRLVRETMGAARERAQDAIAALEPELERFGGAAGLAKTPGHVAIYLTAEDAVRVAELLREDRTRGAVLDEYLRDRKEAGR